MSPLKIDIQDFRKHFGERVFFSDNDIRQYLLRRKIHLNENTLRWHIHQLKENHTLQRVKRGVYTLSRKPVFKAQLDKEIRRLYHEVTGAFSPDLHCIVWSTEWLHQFMVLQPTQKFVIFETEKEWMDSLFQLLKDAGQPAFLNPSKEILEQYILGRGEAFIVRSLISRAPSQQVDDIETPALEKILVDMITDTDLFSTYQGSELENIFLHAWKNYFLNLSMLLNYARRRRRVDKLLDFVRNLPDQELYKVLSK